MIPNWDYEIGKGFYQFSGLTEKEKKIVEGN